MSTIKSLLKLGLDSLSGNVKGAAIPNAMKKQGVTNDEMKFADLDIDPKKTYSAEDRVALEGTRKDHFAMVEPETAQYNWASMPQGQNNPTYKEKVYTFKEGTNTAVKATPTPQEINTMDSLMIRMEEGQETGIPDEAAMKELEELVTRHGFDAEGEEGLYGYAYKMVTEDNRYTSSHYGNVPNYLMHTRSYNASIGNSDTRVLQEIQSDLHQDGRQFSYSKDGVPETPYEKSWLAKGIERELVSTIEDGQHQLAIPISGSNLEGLSRGEGVQKWYETQVLDTAKKIAKKQGMDFELVTDKNTQYAVIKPKINGGEVVEGQGDFKLYASPVAAVGAAYLAMRDGGDPSRSIAEQGFDEQETKDIITEANKIKEAVSLGYGFEESIAMLRNREPVVENVADQEDSSVLDWVAEKYEAVSNIIPTLKQEAAMTRLLGSDLHTDAASLLADLQVIRPNMTSITHRAMGALGNSEQFQKARLLETKTAIAITAMASERGFELKFSPNEDPDTIDQLMGAGKFKYNNGEAWVPLDAGFWATFEGEKSEMAGAVVGAIAGAKKTPFKHPMATLAGSIIGAVTGAVAGSQVDYLRKSIELQEELSANIAFRKAVTASEASVLGDMIGYPVVRIGSKLVNMVKTLGSKGPAGRGAALAKEYMFLSDSEAQDLVIQLRNATDEVTDQVKTQSVDDFYGKTQARNVGSKLSKDQQTIRSIINTTPGAEEILKAASRIDPQASHSVTKAIDDRAKDVTKAIDSINNENAGKVLVEDLGNFTAKTKQFYRSVVNQAADSPNAGNFSFDFEKLAIKPVLDRLELTIQDTAVLSTFVNQAKIINRYTDARTLGDLIDLRQVVNDVRFNKRAVKGKDRIALNEVINNIDELIEVGAEKTMPKQWIKDFSDAKSTYARMKRLEKNSLSKVMNRKGIDQGVVVKALTKYITAMDGTFQEVMTELPKKARHIAENAVIENLMQKWTIGKVEGRQAINFTEYSKSLEQVTFTNPEARSFKAAIAEVAEVFRNDQPLGMSSSGIQIQPFQSFLTADPAVRAKLALASSVFNYSTQFIKADTALVMQAVKVLKAPLNAKAFDDLIKSVDGDINLTEQMVKFRQEAAREAADSKTSANVVLYGDGKILSAKGSGEKHLIAGHRIASHAQVKVVADTYGVDGKMLDRRLKGEGFAAIMTGSDSVRKLK